MDSFKIVFGSGGIIFLLLFTFLVQPSPAQELSKSFELRYYSKDAAADGITDFHGETEIFDTEERIDFLRQYADYASIFFKDPGLNTKVVKPEEVHDFLESLKPQPLPSTRQRISLESCKWLGYLKGQHLQEQSEVEEWNKYKDAEVREGSLVFTRSKTSIHKPIPSQTWRMYAEFDMQLDSPDLTFGFKLVNDNESLIEVGVSRAGNFYFESDEKIVTSVKCIPGNIYHLKLEVDLKEKAYNLYLDDRLVADFTPLAAPSITHIDAMVIEGSKNVRLDNIYLIGYTPTENVGAPYEIHTLLDEDFQIKPDIEGWYLPGYDDSQWGRAKLPKVHGGERYAGEDLYIRKNIYIDKFERAELNIETLDPGGKIWVNGEIVAVIHNRHPVKVDISAFVKPGSENLICIQVNSGNLTKPMHHAPDNFHMGWFAGRSYIDLSAESFIDHIFTYAGSTRDPAVMKHRIEIHNESESDFTGSLSLKYFPWYPEESLEIVASSESEMEIHATSRVEFRVSLDIQDPVLWTSQKPALYKVVAELKNEQGVILDDYVFTTGIRTVGQEDGIFRINGEPEMLNGAQIIGYRVPADKLALWNRCAPVEKLAEELMMIRRMNGNLLRVHVHAERFLPDGINDPRIAEMADQLGIMLIWLTPAWIRNGEWCNVDFEGYPKYIKQVCNHPSIVLWEVTNHPWAKKRWETDFYNRFYETVYQTIYPVDPSRLISPTSHIMTTFVGNDEGTFDIDGIPIETPPEYRAPMITRGNQDSFTGYGREWSDIRNLPDAYTAGFLNSPHRAYFNFEHEESIGQPNWSLAKGKPWYKLQSYEWEYDQGSIGRRLDTEQWRESQAWQAFSAWESMKKQRILDYDGFSWCCLHGGPNMGTYKKPLIDALGFAKLSYHVNKMIFQRTVAGSNNVDVVYSPADSIHPVIMSLDQAKKVDLIVTIQKSNGEIVQEKTFKNVALPAGRKVTELPAFKPDMGAEGYYYIEYQVVKSIY